MTYRVVYTKPFQDDIDRHVDYLVGEDVSIQTIMNWYDQLFAFLDGLDELPKRFAVDEKMTEMTERVTRKCNFGDYLIFYRVLDEDRRIELLHLQHGSQERERYMR